MSSAFNLTKKLTGPTKGKEQHESSLKNKGKKMSKASKTIINQNPMKFNTARHPETASNLSEPIEKSKKRRENCRKTRHF